jgi:hypothetical protein
MALPGLQEETWELFPQNTNGIVFCKDMIQRQAATQVRAHAGFLMKPVDSVQRRRYNSSVLGDPKALLQELSVHA